MSLSINKLRPVKVIEPILNFEQEYYYAVLKGAERTTWKPIVSTSYSQSSATFSAPPPNPNIAVNRRIKLVQPITIDFIGNAPVDTKLLQSGYDALRAFPLSTNISTLQIDLNNNSFSINMSDTIQALLRYHNKEDLTNGSMSLTPSLLDQSQQYSDLSNSIRNPLSSYIDSNYGSVEGRGGFPYNTIVNNTSTGILNDTTAQITTTLCEDLYLSPLIFGTDCQETGFIGLQTFQLIVNWNSDLSRFWCHDDSGGTTLTSITVTLGQPTLLFEYKTPGITEPIPNFMQYPYYEVQRYPTDTNSAILSGSSTIIQSSNIQLNSIPRMMYIYGRKRNQDLTFTDTDTFLSIEKISINWANNSGLLSSTTKRDLYYMSRKNGCNMSWTQWSGESNYLLSGTTIQAISGPGSVLAVEFGTDIGLPTDEAPGLNGTYQLQMEVTFKNNSSASITPTLYVVIVNEGIFTLENNSAYSQIGVISRADVISASKEKGINYEDLKYMSGAAFAKNFRRRLSKIFNLVKKYSPQIKKGIELATKYGPTVAKLAGLGYEKNICGEGYSGGVKPKRKYTKRKSSKKGGILLSGGERISKKDLEEAMKEYY